MARSDSRLALADLCCLLVALVGLVATEFAGVADAAPLRSEREATE